MSRVAVALVHRVVGALAFGATLAALPMLAACAVCNDCPSRTLADGGGLDFDDAGLGTGSPTDASGVDAAVPDSRSESSTDASGLGSETRACLDGVDGSANGLVDCDDAACDATAGCCVGVTSGACCAPSAPVLEARLAGCADLAVCAPTVRSLGAPVLDAAGLSAPPEEGAPRDHGVVSADLVDARAGTLTLRAGVDASIDADHVVDVIAFGLGDAPAPGAARALPALAAVWSVGTAELSLVAGDAILARAGLAPTAGALASLTLTVAPDGAVTLTHPGGSLEARVALPTTPSPVLAFARAAPSATHAPARLASLVVARDACDAPSALALAPLTVRDEAGGVFVAGTIRNPSRASTSTGAHVLVFDAVRANSGAAAGERAIFYAVEAPDAPDTFVVRNPSLAGPAPALDASSVPGAASVIEPALRQGATGLVLYATAVATNGTHELVRTVAADSAGTGRFTGAARLIALDGSGNARDLDHPAPFDGLGGESLLAREHLADGTTALVALSVNPDALTAAPAADLCGVDEACDTLVSRTSSALARARTGEAVFDADEVAAPTVVSANGLFRLYYSGRRGTRWALGLLISADGRYWRRALAGGAALDGGHGDADRLGVRGPDASLERGQVELLVEGWNGLASSSLVARGPR